MIYTPMPSDIYASFEQTVALFKQCLNGRSITAAGKQVGLNPRETEKRLDRLANHLIHNWEISVKQGSSDPAPMMPPTVPAETGIHYFSGMRLARNDKAFWLVQMAREQARYDQQRAEEQKSEKPIHISQLGLKHATSNWLAANELHTVAQLLSLTTKDYATMIGIGEVKRREISAALLKHNLMGSSDKEKLEQVNKAGFIGFKQDGSLDLISQNGAECTVQLDGSFTRKQLEQLTSLMKEKEYK